MHSEKRHGLPSHHPVQEYHLCRPCQEYPVEKHHVWSWCFCQVLFISEMLIPLTNLQVLLWVHVPLELLWGQFYPVQRHIKSHSCIHLSVHMSYYTSMYNIDIYGVIYVQFLLLVLWIPVDLFLQHHPGDIRWNTHSYSLMGPAISPGCSPPPDAVFIFCCFFDAHDKQEETHCLADDADDAWFASEARQTLGTKWERRTGSAWMKRLRLEHERSCSGEKGTLHSRSHLLGLLRLPSGPANPWDHVGPENKALDDR